MSKLLLYCAKTKPYLYGMYSGFESRYGYHLTNDKNVYNQHSVLNGKIVAECEYEVGRLSNNNIYEDYLLEHNSELWENDILTKSCLTYDKLNNYLSGNGYAIDIKDLNIFDKPKELSDCHKIITVDDADFNENDYKYVPITKAPQNMMRVWLYENGEWVMYILISIQPQWMCLILNRIKDIEIRKVVLKEMLNNE